MIKIIAATACACALAAPSLAGDRPGRHFPFEFSLRADEARDAASAQEAYQRLRRETAEACRVRAPGVSRGGVDRACQDRLMDTVVAKANRKALSVLHGTPPPTRLAHR